MITPLVIKLGGAVLQMPNVLEQLFKTLAENQQQVNRQVLIVHGGGFLIDDLLSRLNFDTKKKQGIRVTPYEQIPFITGALAGTANKLLQGIAIKQGLQTIGLCLSDGDMCHISPLDSSFGSVGKAQAKNDKLLTSLLSMNLLPIINSIGLTQTGDMMNVNADDAAVAVSANLDADLVLLSDVSGVFDHNKHLIDCLSYEESEQLIRSNVIIDGMVIKVRSAFSAVKKLNKTVQIASWKELGSLKKILENKPVGTQFIL